MLYFINDFKDKHFNYADIELNSTSIYIYLKNKTLDFDTEVVKRVLKDMKMYYDMTIGEERLKMVNDAISRNEIELDENRIVDYTKMYEKLFGIAYDIFYYEAIALLESKLFYNTSYYKSSEKQIPEMLNTPEAQAYLRKAIELGLMDENYKWKKSKSLCAYFASIMSDKLRLNNSIKGARNEKKRISWKPFEILFGYERGTLRQAKNDYEKVNIDPQGSDIVDKIFK